MIETKSCPFCNSDLKKHNTSKRYSDRNLYICKSCSLITKLKFCDCCLHPMYYINTNTIKFNFICSNSNCDKYELLVLRFDYKHNNKQELPVIKYNNILIQRVIMMMSIKTNYSIQTPFFINNLPGQIRKHLKNVEFRLWNNHPQNPHIKINPEVYKDIKGNYSKYAR